MIPSSRYRPSTMPGLERMNTSAIGPASSEQSRACRPPLSPASGRGGGIVPIRAADRSSEGTLPPRLRNPLTGIEPKIDRPETGTQTAPRARLMRLPEAARYLSLSYWTVRDLIGSGEIPTVRLPSPGTRDGRSLRRILIDVRDLDALIAKWKERSA